jgi:hypothetical protein
MGTKPTITDASSSSIGAQDLHGSISDARKQAVR